jgi:sugar/nucleoside kinase (ribokinase family)
VTVALQRHDYTAVGHVTIDVLKDGSRRAGGTVLYSALQASRLGLRTLVITRGVTSEVERLLAPFASELDVEIVAAAQTTTLATSGTGAARVQRMLAWAGPIEESIEIDSAILHLAPVARETPLHWRGEAGFLALTPQGLARTWAGVGERVALAAPAPASEALAARCDALVVSEHERDSCSALLAAARGSGGVVAITDGARPSTVIADGAGAARVAVPPIATTLDDLGAGDVFAAAFFVALSERHSPVQAAEFATAAAAVRMSGDGAAAIGDRHAIATRISRTSALGR